MFLKRVFCEVGLGKPSKFIYRTYTDSKNPFTRTWDVLSNDLRQKKKIFYPEHSDIVIIGGGIIGSSIAYSLKHRAGPGLSVVVLDKNLSNNVKEMQNNVLLGTLSQHYSLPENIYLSQYSAEFFRNIKENLNSNVDIQYNPLGRLVLASEKYAEQLEQNVSIQREHGTKNELISPDEIRKRFPWIDTTDIQLGCISTECDGVFNASKYLNALIKSSKDLGATYVDAELIGFELERQRDVLMEGVEPGSYQKIKKLSYKTQDDEIHDLNFAACILAAGEQSGHIAKMAKIGDDEGLLTVPLPIEKREYNVYSIQNNPEALPVGLNTPFIMDTSGLWFRRNQLENNSLCGLIPSFDINNNEHLKDELDTLIKPSLVNRFPGCKNIKIDHIGTEVYDYNSYDDTGILGPHVYHGTLYFATGFGALGCQHAPGIGRAIAELIIDGHFTTIDLTRLGFDRLLVDYPLIESNVY
ncbi:FAD-dependent oxidoreductase domain-containing protein 1 [Epargyreus clarus]|uniref:FAD-dependent oxidoreductase domain-containing protein 1 n=1 Tax=Epargyreus clarus TaxID=520877 RepID=UPI003C2C4241